MNTATVNIDQIFTYQFIIVLCAMFVYLLTNKAFRKFISEIIKTRQDGKRNSEQAKNDRIRAEAELTQAKNTFKHT